MADFPFGGLPLRQMYLTVVALHRRILKRSLVMTTAEKASAKDFIKELVKDFSRLARTHSGTKSRATLVHVAVDSAVDLAVDLALD